MRKIKFRVWDDKKKEMFFCKDLYFLSDGRVIGSNEIKWESIYSPPTKMSPNIMQYTGLKDKNKKEIYEGDTIRVYTKGEKKIKYTGVVTYCGLYAKFVLKLKDFKKHECVPYLDFWEICDTSYELYIIGNIYENPELLVEENFGCNRFERKK